MRALCGREEERVVERKKSSVCREKKELFFAESKGKGERNQESSSERSLVKELLG